MNWTVLLSATAWTLAVVLALEAAYLLLRQPLRRHALAARWHLLVVALAVLCWCALAERADGAAFRVAAFLAVVFGAELALRAGDRLWLGKRQDPHGRPAVSRLVRDLGILIVVFAVAVLAAHAFLDVPYARFLLPSAVVSAVLGFALQDVLKNVFAGLLLQTEVPFAPGDWILLDGVPMQVLEVTLHSTRLRSNLGLLVREPNATLVASRISNLGSGQRAVGFTVEVGVAYGSPPALVKASLERAARETGGVASLPPPNALVKAFADSAVLYELRFWTAEVHRLNLVQNAVRTRVWYQLQRDGWKIPFPIRTVQMEPARAVDRDRRRWQQDRVESLLARVDLFAALPEEVRGRLARTAQHRYYDAGEALVREGDRDTSLFLLARGAVSVAKAAGEVGAERLQLATLGEGDYFGETSLLTGEPRSATVTAEEPCEAFVLGREDLAPILEQDPSVAETLSRVLAERTAATDARIEHRRGQMQQTVEEEEASLLQRIRRYFKLT
jgi:small-conductance mechanosensitive channel/CRP-like cAMP-binding protein